MKKKVKILNNGIIPGTSLLGPILNPLYMETSEISGLILHGAIIQEVLSNGTEIKLDMTNFLEDNENKFVVQKEQIEKLERKTLDKINKRRSFSNEQGKKEEKIDITESV